MVAGQVQVLFGLDMLHARMDEVVALCADAIHERRCIQVGVVNAAKIVASRSNPELTNALMTCDILLPDGQSVVWASRLLGRPLPERVTGIDLFERLLELADRDGFSVYLLGARPEVLAELEIRIRRRFPGLSIAGSQHGYFQPDEVAGIVSDIQRSDADMLFLGMASPRKEIFIGDHGKNLGVAVLHGVGGSFDVLAGVTRRAPVRLQRLGLEWLYRLAQEPRRLWRRYLTSNASFAMLTLLELVRRTPQPARGWQHTDQ